MKRALMLVVACSWVAVACSGSSSDGEAQSLTIYSGREEELIGATLERFEADTGITLEVRYGDSADLAALIQTEGDQSPADLYVSQSPGALGLLSSQELLAPIDSESLNRVEPAFRSVNDDWVGLTARVRTLVYNTETVDPSELPASVFDLVDPKYAGRVGVAPTNGSFQDFVTAMRVENGDEATAEWLAGMGANGSPNYPKNSAIVEAVGRGEIDMGLVNHYYNLRAKEADPSVPSENYFFPDGDVGSIVIVSGVGILKSSEKNSTAQELVTYLLSDDSQNEFVGGEQEYPVVQNADITGPAGAPPLSSLSAAPIDFADLGAGLEETQQLIRDSGIEN